jgi:hypothetical protein
VYTSSWNGIVTTTQFETADVVRAPLRVRG